MDKLPLFPLHTVLFPGMPLSLHIFEERYRLMVERSLTGRTPFGVVLIRTGPEAGGSVETYAVGTLANIVRAERLPDNRYNIEIVGHERFTISRLDYSEPYLVAEVKAFPLALSATVLASRAAARLFPLFTGYLSLLGSALNRSSPTIDLPRDPAALAFVAGVVAQVPLGEKQTLLETASCVDLLNLERQLYRRELALLRHMLSTSGRIAQSAFSPN